MTPPPHEPAPDDDEELDLPDMFEAPDPAPGDRPPLPRAEEPAPDDGPGCIRCGNSCRSVYLWQGDLADFKEQDTKKWVEFHEGIETFTAKQPDGRTFWGIKLPSPCTHLIETAPGEFGCAIYDRRPYVCRVYKGINPDGPQPGCGYFGVTRAIPARPYTTRQVAEHALTRHDQDELQALLRTCFPDQLSERIWFKQLPNFRLLTYEGDRLVAQVGVEHRIVQNGDRRLRPVFGVVDLCVHPDHRNRGLADALLARLEGLASEHNVTYVVLFADDDRVYRKRGYRHVSNEVKFLGIDDGNTVGILEGSFPDIMLVKEMGKPPWPDGPVDLLGYLF